MNIFKNTLLTDAIEMPNANRKLELQNRQLFLCEPPLHPLSLQPRGRGRDQGVLHRAARGVLRGGADGRRQRRLRVAPHARGPQAGRRRVRHEERQRRILIVFWRKSDSPWTGL